MAGAHALLRRANYSRFSLLELARPLVRGQRPSLIRELSALATSDAHGARRRGLHAARALTLTPTPTLTLIQARVDASCARRCVRSLR